METDGWSPEGERERERAREDGMKGRMMAVHAKQMLTGSDAAAMWLSQRLMHSQHVRQTRLPEASFLGLSVKPYIHTADKRRKERSREVIQLDSMQKQQYGKARLLLHHNTWMMHKAMACV